MMVECKIICETLSKISLVVDGVDISDKVDYFDLSCYGGEVPRLRVSMPLAKFEVSLPCEMEKVEENA